jgi:hypothetical protein
LERGEKRISATTARDPIEGLNEKYRYEKKFETERMVEEIQKYPRKWYNRVERTPPELLSQQEYLLQGGF